MMAQYSTHSAVALAIACVLFGVANGALKTVIVASVDGLHQFDLARYVATFPNSTMAMLSQHAVTYTNATTSFPSDSYPGTVALFCGATPAQSGIWYDVSFARDLWAPGSCAANALAPTGPPGTLAAYDESIEYNNTLISGGGLPGYDGSSIDPTLLPLDANCNPVHSYQYLQSNTVFEVAKAAGKRTAYIDKHASYELMQGPSGQGLSDLYTPEQACVCADAKGQPTIQDGSGMAYDHNYTIAPFYDQLHVQAVLNLINGRDTKNLTSAPTPAIIGFNFQAVSVAEKYSGYNDTNGTPNPGLAANLAYVDGALGSIVAALTRTGQLNTTAIILTAKHGQSPLGPASAVQNLKESQFTALLAASNITVLQETEDDVALLWLADSTQTSKAITLIQGVANNASVGIVGATTPAAIGLGGPLTSRAPDVIVQTALNTIFYNYKPGKAFSFKFAEHGGNSTYDRNIPLLVYNPTFAPATVTTPVATTQVAGTTLALLGLDPNALTAKPGVLPGLPASAIAAAPTAGLAASG